MSEKRIKHHPILGEETPVSMVTIYVDGVPYTAREGEMVAAALMANGIRTFRFTPKYHKPRSLFCAIGKCTDCMMTIDGILNVRTCITPVRDGMHIETQHGVGEWPERTNL